MDGNSGLLYGLELQSRALSPQYAESNEVRFFVATNSLKPTNQVHLVEYNEEHSNVQSKIFAHTLGEVWKVTASHHNARLLATCFNSGEGAHISSGAALLVLPESFEEEEVKSEFRSWGNIEQLDTAKFGEKLKTLEFHPTQQQLMGVVVDAKVIIYDFADGESRSAAELLASAPNKSGTTPFTTGKWSYHHQGNQFITLHETSVRCYDVRDAQHCAWVIDEAHSQMVRDLDCNPNKQCHIVTGGDDGYVKIWDCRMYKNPVFSRSDHAHWVWSVRFNTFHDQLILSSSSDNKVLLTCAGSVSSEVVTNTSNQNLDLSTGSLQVHEPHCILPDGLLQTFDQHEDSVYCAEWSNVDPWIYASLSYDGCLLISKVPNQYKYQIMSS